MRLKTQFKATEDEVIKGIIMLIRHHIDKFRAIEFLLKQSTNLTNLSKICDGIDPFYKKYMVDFKLTFMDNVKIQPFFENKVPKIVSFLEFKGELSKHSKILTEFLRKDKVITKLRICWSDLNNNDFKELTNIAAYNEKITEFDLTGNLFGDEGANNLISNLAKNTSIEKLNISYNQINKKGVKVICGFIQGSPIITSLNFEGNNLIKCIGIINNLISSNIFLEELNLSSSSITDKEIKVISVGLKKNKTLKKLLLNDNTIKLEGTLMYKNRGQEYLRFPS